MFLEKMEMFRKILKNLKMMKNYRKNQDHYIVMLQSTVHTNLTFYFLHIGNLSVGVLLLY